jgi:hypothetical protein
MLRISRFSFSGGAQMPGKAAKVVITERQQKFLEEFSRSRSEAKAISQRATIILLAFDKKSNEEISIALRLERKQVGLWRRRWQQAWESLTRLECAEPRRLGEAIRETLRDAPRSGRPGTFTAAQITLILALACEPPSQSDRPITHWTPRELRDEILKRKIVDSISVSRVGHFLREAALQPHRRKMWLNTTEKDPEVFEQAVDEVCKTYLNAPILGQQGMHTISCDEMTGVQALERAAADKPLRPEQIAREEFEYIRHGTTTLIGSFDVVSGEMCDSSIGPTRTEVDFVAHIQHTVAADPTGEWVFIVDTLNTHWSAGLVEWIAQECEPDRPLGKKRQSGCAQKPSHASRIPFRSGPPHPVRVFAEA